MIIAQSSIQLSQASNQYQRLSMEATTQQTSTNSAASALRPLELTSQHSFQAQQSIQSKLQSNSRISYADQRVEQHAMVKTSAQLTQVQLHAESAQIAIKHAFPSQANSEIEASGLAEFQFKQQIHFQQGSQHIISASGQVSLSDGRQIDFNLQLQHQQHTSIQALSQLSLQQVAMHDPLVINLGDQPVQLRDTTFEFDLLANGENARYAALGGGAGYLTFDANGDGRVTDGSELFGTRTCDAYAELTEYDDDGNGWIDENDRIFSQLKIWLDQTDDGSTISLAQAGVGAIYLGQVPFEYALRDQNGALQGQSKAAGLVLMENGEVKTSQAIDLMPLIKQDWQKMEDSPAFKNLQRMTDTLNHWIEQVNRLREQFSAPMSSANRQTSTFTPTNAAESSANWFEELQKNIQKMVDERRAFFDRLFGNSPRKTLGQA